MTEIIKPLIERITRYEWFTIFLPGIFLLLIGKAFGMLAFVEAEGWSFLFAAIFWGYVSYATGETIVEWVVKKFCPFAPYPEYVEWSKSDKENASMLVGNLNMFRSLTGMAVLLFVICLVEQVPPFMNDIRWWKNLENKRLIALVIYLCVIFVWAYVKQIKYIKERIKKHLDDGPKMKIAVGQE